MGDCETGNFDASLRCKSAPVREMVLDARRGLSVFMFRRKWRVISKHLKFEPDVPNSTEGN